MGHKFKTSDKVIVRDTNDRLIWRFDIFSHYNSNDSIHQYVTIGGVWECCLPYEGNEYLVGAIRDPEIEMELTFGQKVVAWDSSSYRFFGIFVEKDTTKSLPYCILKKDSHTMLWYSYCEPYDWE